MPPRKLFPEQPGVPRSGASDVTRPDLRSPAPASPPNLSAAAAPAGGSPASSPASGSVGGGGAGPEQGALGIPQFDESPIGAIGFLLQEFSAGLQGREPPHIQMQRNALEQQAIELDMIRTGAAVMEQARRFVQNTPRGSQERTEVVGKLQETIGGVLPGFGEMVSRMDDLPDAEDVLMSVQEFAPQLQAMCGSDVDCIIDRSSDPKVVGVMKERADEKNRPVVGSKLAEWRRAIAAGPDELRRQLGSDAFGNVIMTLSDLERLNKQAPEQFRMSESEFNTLRRNPDILAAHGIQSPELTTKVAETTAIERAKEPFRQAAAGRAAAVASAGRREAGRLQIELENIRAQNRKELETLKQTRVETDEQGERLATSVQGLQTIATGFEQLSELGSRGVAVTGEIASAVGGATGLIFGEDADRFVTSIITQGDDTSGEVKAAQRTFREIVAGSIPKFEELFGRISEAERQIAEKASGLLDNLTSKANVEDALEAAFAANLMALNRGQIQTGAPEIFDARDDKKLLEQVKQMSADFGIPIERMARIAGTVIDGGIQARRIEMEARRSQTIPGRLR